MTSKRQGRAGVPGRAGIGLDAWSDWAMASRMPAELVGDALTMGAVAGRHSSQRSGLASHCSPPMAGASSRRSSANSFRSYIAGLGYRRTTCSIMRPEANMPRRQLASFSVSAYLPSTPRTNRP